MKKIVIVMLVMAGLLGCSEEQQSNEKLISQSKDTLNAAKAKISSEVIVQLINSVPSPLETTFLIKDAGWKYNASILNPSDNSSKYTTGYQNSLNLGIYATDLGYINIYEKKKDALLYLNSIKTLSDNLNIGQFFSFDVLKRLTENSKNFDSLLYITTTNFEKISAYLQEHNRSEQSVLLMTGGWMEALYLTCLASEQTSSKQLYEKVGEQKIILDQIIQLLEYFKNDPEIMLLLKDLNELKTIYNGITITQEYKESTMEEVDGILVIVDHSESKVSITPEQVEAIRSKVIAIRGKIIS